ncbi:MAG: CoB--CoM heterodisulfide reductase iron-sulfur subunit B family protein [Kiritimatiellae bacterium]|nr:CoB--CoM heterodisulfide reductase iron-sulfur subunit B family protein [Kiritimatiellia bacterium]
MTTEVSFYPGCTAHSTGLEYSLSLHAVFERLGVKLTEIDDWNCCGGAAAHCLSELLGLALPARNIAQAQKLDLPLAIPCPGCFNAVKRAQHALESDPAKKQQLQRIIGFEYKGGLQVKAMHEVLLEQVGLEKVAGHVRKPLAGLKVASYYGCALVRNPKIVRMGDHENPMFLDELVEALGGRAQDWSYKVDCCGADLAMTHGKIAKDLADKICVGAVEAGADCIMSSCGLCQINLDMKQTGRNSPKIPVLYFTELMGVAFDVPGRNVWWMKHMVDPEPMLRAHGMLE